jgi:hypothetical protein
VGCWALIGLSTDRVKTLTKYFIALLVFLGLQLLLGQKRAVEGGRLGRRPGSAKKRSDIAKKAAVARRRK